MLVFQLLIYPRIVKRIGARTSQRWACCVSIPVFLAYPLLSRLHNSGAALWAASLVLLFLTNVASSAVGSTVASIQSIFRACTYRYTMLVYDGHRINVIGRAERLNAAVQCYSAMWSPILVFICDGAIPQ